MKWYNYKHIWINIEKIIVIKIYNEKIGFYGQEYHIEDIFFKNNEERDAEFAKIKILMGIEDFTSRCC